MKPVMDLREEKGREVEVQRTDYAAKSIMKILGNYMGKQKKPDTLN